MSKFDADRTARAGQYQEVRKAAIRQLKAKEAKVAEQKKKR
jgi:hypothetical protein